MLEVPSYGESIYFWCYRCGLAGIEWSNVEQMATSAGHSIRPKDYNNWLNGANKHGTYSAGGFKAVTKSWSDAYVRSPKGYDLLYPELPNHPCLDYQPILDRWVPCNQDNKPMIKWSKERMTREAAEAVEGQKYLGENLMGTDMIVFDIDGDHGEGVIDAELIRFALPYISKTHTLIKPRLIGDYPPERIGQAYDLVAHSASFHLLFKVDKVIPTMHFPKAHIDLIGNRVNTLRYRKNKVWNGLKPMIMTPDIWSDIMRFIRERQES